MTGSTFLHDPGSVLDYQISWSDWLADGDTIATATWTIPTGTGGLIFDPFQVLTTTTSSTVWVSGGTVGADYELVCHITTAQGRQDDRTIRLLCRQR